MDIISSGIVTVSPGASSTGLSLTQEGNLENPDIDTTAPVITLTADTETVVLQTTLTATVDDGSTIQYRIGEFGLWRNTRNRSSPR